MREKRGAEEARRRLEERADRSIGRTSGKRDGTREDPSFRGGRDHRREADEKLL